MVAQGRSAVWNGDGGAATATRRAIAAGCLGLLLVGAALFAGAAPPATASHANAAHAVTAVASHPVRFELNQGQTDQRVRFLARSNGVPMYLTANEAVFVLMRSMNSASAASATLPATKALPATDSISGAVVRLHLTGANPHAQITGVGELPGATNYLIGNDPSKWHTGVRSYAQVRYRGVYPGIDLVYHAGPDGAVEYDFVLAPGANPNEIQIEVLGASGVAASADGGVRIDSAGGALQQRAPTIYQEINGARRTVQGGYSVTGGRIGFSIAPHDTSKPLVIDPQLLYSTYLGGATGYGNYGSGIAADASGSAYVTGAGISVADFPTTTGAFETSEPAAGTFPPTWNAFVTKFAPDGTSLVYSTYVGGSGGHFYGGDVANGIAVDPNGDAYIAGATNSANFPVTPTAIQQTLQNSSPYVNRANAFFTKLNAQGSGLDYSTYLGGDGGPSGFAWDQVNGIAVDASGIAYLAGFTGSTNFPLTANAYQSPATCTVNCLSYRDGVTTSGSTTFSSATADFSAGDAGAAISGPDVASNTHIATVNSPTTVILDTAASGTSGGAGAPFTVAGGSREQSSGFLTKVDPTKSGAAGLVYSTLLGGTLGASAAGIALDNTGAIYVAGLTHEAQLATSGAYQTACASTCAMYTDGVLSGSRHKQLTSATAGFTQADVSRSVYGPGLAIGTTIAAVHSTTSVTLSAAAPANGGTSFIVQGRPGESFVSKFAPALGSTPVTHTTYFGQQASNLVNGLAVDGAGSVYLTGYASSPDFPTTSAAFDHTPRSGRAGFASKLSASFAKLSYSTYIAGASAGGSIGSTENGIAVDSAGEAVVVGDTGDGATFPVKDQVAAYGGDVDATITELNATGSLLQWSTFMGGHGSDYGNAVGVDAAGTVYVTGDSISNDFPTTPGAFQQNFGGGLRLGDAFVAKLAHTAASAPAITGITPTHGPLSGHTTVTITGHGFTGGSRLSLGSIRVFSFVVNSLTQITATTPAVQPPPLGSTLSPGFTVTTSKGTSADNPVDRFTYGKGQWTATGALSVARHDDTATLLGNGNVLVAGGLDNSGNPLASAEVYNPSTGTWSATGSMATARYYHTATLLQNGKVLVVGGAEPNGDSTASVELYDPAATGCGTGITGCWTTVAPMPAPTFGHTATLLQSGRVLVAGGQRYPFNSNQQPYNTAYVYDAAANTWTQVGSMTATHTTHTATLLPNGKVLVVGGCCVAPRFTESPVAELFDPAATGCGTGITGCWTATGSLIQARFGHTATLFSNGKVLVAGGSNFGDFTATRTMELYDPAAGTWSLAGVLQHARSGQTATLLPDGTALLAGGLYSIHEGGSLQTAEIVEPANPSATVAADEMLISRGFLDDSVSGGQTFTATLLANGTVLVTGGSGDASAEIYTPAP